MQPTLSIVVNHRQQLAQAIRFAVEHREWEPRKLANAMQVPLSLLLDWMNARAIPDSNQWMRLRKNVRALDMAEHSNLVRAARAEQDAEDKQRSEREAQQRYRDEAERQRNNHKEPIVTNIGDKLCAVAPEVAEEGKEEMQDTDEEAPMKGIDNPSGRLREWLRGKPVGSEVTIAQATAALGGPSHERSAEQSLAWLRKRGEVAETERGFAIVALAKVDKHGRAISTVPVGSKSREEIEKRMQFARGLFMQRPYATLGGEDGIHKIMRQRFGVSLDGGTLNNIRNDVLTAHGKDPVKLARGGYPTPAVRGETPALTQATSAMSLDDVPAAGVVSYGGPPVAAGGALVTSELHGAGSRPANNGLAPIVGSGRDPADDVQAAVSLLLESIPNLRTFSITVDDQGEASVDFTTRQVKVVEAGGSLKLSTKKV